MTGRRLVLFLAFHFNLARLKIFFVDCQTMTMSISDIVLKQEITKGYLEAGNNEIYAMRALTMCDLHHKTEIIVI